MNESRDRGENSTWPWIGARFLSSCQSGSAIFPIRYPMGLHYESTSRNIRGAQFRLEGSQRNEQLAQVQIQQLIPALVTPLFQAFDWMFRLGFWCIDPPGLICTLQLSWRPFDNGGCKVSSFRQKFRWQWRDLLSPSDLRIKRRSKEIFRQHLGSMNGNWSHRWRWCVHEERASHITSFKWFLLYSCSPRFFHLLWSSMKIPSTFNSLHSYH